MILDARDKPLGVGYVNPHSLICARLISRGLERALDRRLFADRCSVALALRERLHAEPYYRWLYGESDGVPGLTLDRFGDVVVAQATTAGIERLKPQVEAAVREVIDPRAMVWKNDAGIRALEQLPRYADIASARSPRRRACAKAGWNSRSIRSAARRPAGSTTSAAIATAGAFVKARACSTCSPTSAHGDCAPRRWARSEVVCVDASALRWPPSENARRNGLADRVRAERADAFDYLKSMRERREHCDVVILDPPAFVKRKKDFREGALAYRRLNELAMQVLAPDGILVTCSCS